MYSNAIVESGLLAGTTDKTLVPREGEILSADHRSATSTRIVAGPGGSHPDVEIDGRDGNIGFYGPLAGDGEARLLGDRLLGREPTGARRPESDHHPSPRRDPERVLRRRPPDGRAPGHAYNLRSVHERFGMQFIMKARKLLGSNEGTAAGERFTEQYGRLERRRRPPEWPAQVLDGWRRIDPDMAPVLAFLPYLIRS